MRTVVLTSVVLVMSQLERASSFTPALKNASSFALLAGTSLTNAGFSVIVGDVGCWPGVMPPGEPVGATLLGTNYGTGNTTADAQADVANVHAQLMGLDATPIAAELAGVTLGPGVYSSATFLLAAGVLTFDDMNVPPINATWTLVSPGYLLVSDLASMVLLNNAKASNIFWAIGDYASFATHTISIGTVIANNYITFASGASLTGAGLSNAGVTLSAATIVNPRVSANYTSTQTQTITQSVSQTTTSTQSQTVTQILYVTSVNMLSATNFVLLGATDLQNTGPTVIEGDIGSYPGAMGAGEPVGATLRGNNYGALAPSANAQADLLTIYADISSRSATPRVSGLDSTTIYPGVWTCSGYYTLGAGATVTFDGRGNSNAVFIMITSGYLHLSANSAMVLTNGAQASNIFWALGSYLEMNINSYGVGTIVAQSYITINSGATLLGASLSLNAAVSLDSANVVLARISLPFTTTPTETTTLTSSQGATPTQTLSRGASSSQTATVSGTTSLSSTSTFSTWAASTTQSLSFGASASETATVSHSLSLSRTRTRTASQVSSSSQTLSLGASPSQTTTTSMTVTASQQSASDATPNEPLSPGVIAAIVIASLVGFALLVAAAVAVSVNVFGVCMGCVALGTCFGTCAMPVSAPVALSVV